jgi:hypothetical protein
MCALSGAVKRHSVRSAQCGVRWAQLVPSYRCCADTCAVPFCQAKKPRSTLKKGLSAYFIWPATGRIVGRCQIAADVNLQTAAQPAPVRTRSRSRSGASAAVSAIDRYDHEAFGRIRYAQSVLVRDVFMTVTSESMKDTINKVKNWGALFFWTAGTVPTPADGKPYAMRDAWADGCRTNCYRVTGAAALSLVHPDGISQCVAKHRVTRLCRSRALALQRLQPSGGPRERPAGWGGTSACGLAGFARNRHGGGQVTGSTSLQVRSAHLYCCSRTSAPARPGPAAAGQVAETIVALRES